MSVRLNGSTSGYTELDAPAVAGNNTLKMPASNGAANQLLKNGSTAGELTYATATEDSSGNFAFNSGYGSVAPVYGCRAWVNFDGTRDTTGAVSTANTNRLIRASGNVASVLRNGTGDYTITFTTAMPDANYAPLATAQPNTADSIVPANGQCEISIVGTTGSASLPSASGYRIYVGYSGTHPRDVSGMYTAVFR